MGKNSSRRPYRNYNELGVTNNILLPPDVDMPGIAPLVQSDNATAGVRSRATYGKNGLLYYPEIDTPNNLRRSYDSSGQSKGWLIEAANFNYIYGANDFATSGNTVNWSVSGITKGPATGPDGRSGSAAFLTAATTNSTITLARGAIGTGTRRFSVWLRAVSVSGTVSIQVVSGSWVNVAISSSEWRRFTVTAASGQVTCGIRVSNLGDTLLAYGPNLYLGTFDSSTSLPENQLTGFSDNIQSPLPIPGTGPNGGATVFAQIESNVRETGIHSNTTGVFSPGTTGVGTIKLGTLQGDVYASSAFTTGVAGGGSATISVADNVNTFLEDSQVSLGTLTSFSCALSIAPGRLIAMSPLHDMMIVQDPGIVIYDPEYDTDPPYVSVEVTSGAFYIKNLAVWPFAMNSAGLSSLLTNFR
jgi:hypothetical protein